VVEKNVEKKSETPIKETVKKEKPLKGVKIKKKRREEILRQFKEKRESK
jgi:hypothetical protein